MIICINNQKGGTAKTTTTKELGFLSAANRKKTLLIDLDPQFSLSKSFGFSHEQVKGKSIYNVFMEDIDVNEAILKTKYDNLYILPASKDLSMLDVDLALKFNTKLLYNHLRRILEPIRDEFDTILIDTLPSLGMTALNALCVSDWLLIPCVPEEACLTQLEDLIDVANRVRGKLNSSLKYLGILPVMVDKRTTHHKEGINALSKIYSKHYKINVFENHIGVCTSFRDSVALSEPATAIYNDLAVKNYAEVYKEIIEIIGG